MYSVLRAALVAATLGIAASPARAEVLTLEQAVARATAANPSLAAGAAAVDAARAGRLQAAVRPNPIVTVEAEKIIGTSPYNVLEQAEITGTWTETLERTLAAEARRRVTAARDPLFVGTAADARVATAALALAQARARADAIERRWRNFGAGRAPDSV